MVLNLAVGSGLVALSVLIHTAGLILIGWSTAFLVRASTRHGPFRKEHF